MVELFGISESKEVLVLMSWGMIASGALAAALLMCVQAPYGRYQPGSSPAWGFRMDGRLAWVVQECPCFFFAVWMWATADSKVFGAPNKLLLGLYLLHYSHRTWVFPIRMRGGKPTPFLVFLLAFGFCLVNGFLQSRFLTAYAVFPPNWENNPQFMVGVAIFFAGMYINIDSDSILRNLRKGPEDKGYYIPRGGLFDYVSGANFFGEIVEWTGFAIASNCQLPAVAFAVFTVLNVGPRALQHHRDYIRRFSGESKDKPAYPSERRALIPFLL